MNFGIAKIFNAVDKTIQDKFNYLIDLLSKFSADLDVSLTPSEILTKVLTVDGAGSTLDADLLDGVHGSGYLSSSYTGVATDSDPNTTTLTYIVSNHANTPSTSYYWHILTIKYTANYQKQIATGIQSDATYTRFNYMGTWQPWFEITHTNGQIKFPATQNPSTDANTLDDYEEGTFVPTIIGTTVAGTGTYTAQEGIYVKIGKMVSYVIRLAWSAHTGTGFIRVAGLPFTSATQVPCAITYSGITLTAGNVLMAYCQSGQQTIWIEQTPVGGGASNAVNMDTSGGIYFSGIYFV